MAWQVYAGKEEAPLRAHVFTGQRVLDTPDYIIPQEKKDDMVRNWQGKPAAAARLNGEFFSSVPVALPNLNEKIHVLPITYKDLKRIRPNGILYRAIDPGWAHVTACVWGYLTSQNEWFFYRAYSEAQRTIDQRSEDIISLSGNKRILKGNIYVEDQQSESFKASYIDYHTFKADEQTGAAFAYNYIRAGLRVTPSITIGPRERATLLDNNLQSKITYPHPTDPKLPGARVYFLTGDLGNGIPLVWDKLSNLFWQSYEQGLKKGTLKEQLQDLDDDEFDAVSYLAASNIRYQEFKSTSKQSRTRDLENSKSDKIEMMGDYI